jgi:hypothetical protein
MARLTVPMLKHRRNTASYDRGAQCSGKEVTRCIPPVAGGSSGIRGELFWYTSLPFDDGNGESKSI